MGVRGKEVEGLGPGSTTGMGWGTETKECPSTTAELTCLTPGPSGGT